MNSSGLCVHHWCAINFGIQPTGKETYVTPGGSKYWFCRNHRAVFKTVAHKVTRHELSDSFSVSLRCSCGWDVIYSYERLMWWARETGLRVDVYMAQQVNHHFESVWDLVLAA